MYCIINTITHHPWSWIRDPAFISSPLVVGTLFVSKGSVESFSDVSHTVNTHSKSLEHIAVEEKGEMSTNNFSFWFKYLTRKVSIFGRNRKLEKEKKETGKDKNRGKN